MSSIRKAQHGRKPAVVYRHNGRQRSLTFATLDQAKQWQARLDVLGPEQALALLDGPAPPARIPTVDETVEHYLSTRTGIEPATLRDYHRMHANHIHKPIGHYHLDMLTDKTAADWVNGLAAKGLSGKTIKNIVYSVLSPALALAVKRGEIPGNVLDDMRLPRTETQEQVFLNAGEVRELVGLTPEYWRPLVATLVLTGMRWGEATALTVGDVDLQEGTIRIHRAWKRGDKKEPGVTKTRRSRRTVRLPVALRLTVRGLMADRGPEEFLFTNHLGGPVRHKRFHPDVWKPLVERFAESTGKRPRIHDLRHTYVSHEIASGKSLTAVQRAVGHESISTTSDVYGHLVATDRDAHRDTIEIDMTEMAAIESKGE